MDDDRTVKIPRLHRARLNALSDSEMQQVTAGDDEPTLKFAPLAHASSTHVAETPPASHEVAANQTHIEQENDASLEYEHIWETPTLAFTPSQSGSQPPIVSPPSYKKPFPKWGRVVVTVFLLLLLLAGGALAYGYYYFETNIQTPLANLIHPVSRGGDESSGNPVPPGADVTGRAWNILLLGSDNDGKYTFPAVLTQVMMIVHIDTVNNNATLVSIPRDSWVYVPEIGGMHKIDQAFFYGVTRYHSFDGGVRIARLTVERDYGITIDRYAWVGLSGFASVIDTLGGIDINVIHPIVDDAYPDDTGANANKNDPFALKRLYLAPGPQHLNGLQALEYVRSRHADLVGDIGRTQRQQQVLEAVKQKLNVSSVLGHLQQLVADLTGKVYTDLSEQEMFGFANFGRTLASEAISRVTLGPGKGDQDYGDFAQVYDPVVGSQQDVVIPHCENIQPLINRVFDLGFALSCQVNGGILNP